MRALIFVFVFIAMSLNVVALEPINLSGAWSVRLDRDAMGEKEKWFSQNSVQGQAIKLPGNLEENRIGDSVTVDTKWVGDIFDKTFFSAPEFAPYRKPGQVKVPFWLQPDTRFIGAAWFQRKIDLGKDWAGRRVVLELERPHWRTTVWLDGVRVGSNDALSVPHRYVLTDSAQPGEHQLTVRVENDISPDIGTNSHSITDHTQGDWNGIVGRIQLVATSQTWIDDAQIYFDAKAQKLSVRGKIGRTNSGAFPEKVSVDLEGQSAQVAVTIGADGSFVADLPLGAISQSQLWSEFTPVVKHLRVTLPGGEARRFAFGMRDFKAEGRQLAINGTPTFLRGTLDCAAYPRTGYPPTTREEWKRVMTVIKAHGLNHIRFHSWCPPEAAFETADELGLYLQIEVASWPNWSTTLGDGKPVDKWIEAETRRILREYGNHPSFVMLCAGNEPGGEHYSAWLEKWVTAQKQADPRRVYTSGSGWPELAVNDYNVTPEPRIQQWGEGLKSRINGKPPETETDYSDFILARKAPTVSHEIGQWCVYPDFAEMPKYTGYLEPKNFEIFQAGLEAHGMAERAHEFLIASGKLQALCYKEEIESALRTSQMAGFQLLGLSDFPGQGTALVGVLDAFWEEKGYITPQEFSRFCSATVPLARLTKRVFTANENLTGRIDVAHFGTEDYKNASVKWVLQDEQGGKFADGKFDVQTLPTGQLSEVGRIDIPLHHIAAPAKYRLVVQVESGVSKSAEPTNDWDVWVYPAPTKLELAVPEKVTVVTKWDEAASEKLAAGGAIIWMVPPGKVAPDPKLGPIALGFSSIFWNTAWTSRQAPHTLGISCNPKAAALADFPTEPWSNWQWWYPVSHAAAMELDKFPRELAPIVSVVDDWVTNRKLALIFEARCGNGRVLVTSISLNDAVLDPVRRQLRASLFRYAAGDSFRPQTEVTIDQLKSLAIQ